MRELDLNRLKDGLPGVSKARGAEHAEACLVCLGLHEHPVGVTLEAKGNYAESFSLVWDDILTEQVRRAWNDIDDATESGACGIAFLLILDLTEYTIVRQSRKGTGFDYYLGFKENLAFQDAARLEISGIFQAQSERDMMRRVEQKLGQTDRSDGIMPAYVAVVEFASPVAFLVKK